jgi:hypothetical protein
MVRHGIAPFLECSSKGDKRFSAFHARVKRRGGRSIEDIYQAAKVFDDGATGLSWREAKGLKPVNIAEVRVLYSTLWDEYIAENPHLLDILEQFAGVSDMFGKVGNACQATELWRIRNRFLLQDKHKAETYDGIKPVPVSANPKVDGAAEPEVPELGQMEFRFLPPR